MKQALAIGVAAVSLNFTALAAEIAVENFSFEQPGTSKVTGWDNPGNDIPGWFTTGPIIDSGVESDWPGSTHGAWAGFLYNQDPAVYNQTGHAIGPNDIFTLRVDARENWSSTGPAVLSIGFFYESGGNLIPLGSTSVDPALAWSEFAFEFDAGAVPAAFGQPLGIALQNMTVLGDSWIGVDNVRLSVVPEPSVLALFGLAGALLVWRRRLIS